MHQADVVELHLGGEAARGLAGEAAGGIVGAGREALKFEQRNFEVRSDRYYRIGNSLPIIYEESESNFLLDHIRATVFSSGQHGRVS
jgi:hypothetical protein